MTKREFQLVDISILAFNNDHIRLSSVVTRINAKPRKAPARKAFGDVPPREMDCVITNPSNSKFDAPLPLPARLL